MGDESLIEVSWLEVQMRKRPVNSRSLASANGRPASAEPATWPAADLSAGYLIADDRDRQHVAVNRPNCSPPGSKRSVQSITAGLCSSTAFAFLTLIRPTERCRPFDASIAHQGASEAR